MPGVTVGAAAGDGMHVVVLADTHLRDGPGRRWLPDALLDELGRADLVLHAGDVVEPGVLDRLAGTVGGDRTGSGPAGERVRAVLGNNDLALAGRLPLQLVTELAGVRVGMIHDSGPSAGRERRLRERFPSCDVVVFGHSHIPWNRPGMDGQLLFNPGSPTQRRSQPVPTYGRLRLRDGQVEEASVVALPA